MRRFIGERRWQIRVRVDPAYSRETDKVKQFLEGGEVKREIFVPARFDKDNPKHLLNILAKAYT